MTSKSLKEVSKFGMEVRRIAFDRIPETCPEVREALNKAQEAIVAHYGLANYDTAALDIAISAAFRYIRDNVTKRFRVEQLSLLEIAQSQVATKRIRLKTSGSGESYRFHRLALRPDTAHQS